MTFSVAVAGASGYAGGEALRILAGHPEVHIETVTANSNAGARLGDLQPHLRSLADLTLQPTSSDVLSGHDIVVLGLPHGASGELAAGLPADTLVLDLGADHRLVRAADWEEYYHSPHSGTWPYGLPELLHADGTRQRDHLAGVRRIAVPGCNVTAVTLGLQPAIGAGLIDVSDVVAVLAVGYSGAGKKLAPMYLAAEALGSAVPYAVGGTHRHIPEIVQNLTVAGAEGVRISFTPVLVPMSRGILATVTAPLSEQSAEMSDAEVREIWRETYRGEPFMTVLPDGAWPTTGMVLGSNAAAMQVTVDRKAGRLVVVAAIDNLVKGTAGGAVQSMNLALGLPETMGLNAEGVAP